MTVLPVVERELRVASRRRGTYWSRVGSAALAVLIFLSVFLAEAYRSPREMSQTLFVVLAVCFFVLALAAGTVYTADCLSEEKREGTLGLLFLTDLRGIDVVLGKMAASSLTAVYGMLAIFPVMAVPLLMGGVTVQEFGRMVIVLLSTLFMSLAAGLAVSAALRMGVAAMTATALLIVGLNLAGPLVGVAIRLKYPGGAPPEPLLLLSAGFACAAAFEPNFRGAQASFWGSVVWTNAVGGLCLLLASSRVKHSWHDVAVEPAWRRLARRIIQGPPDTAARWRRHLLEIHPCLWLGSRNRWKPRLLWALLGLSVAVWMFLAVRWPHDWANEPAVHVMTLLAAHLVLRLWVAGEAVQALALDRQSGALELLLSTPLGVDRMIQGRLMALRRMFLGPVGVVLAADFWFLLNALGQSPGDRSGWVSFYLTLIAVFLADLVTVAWVGLWQGLVQVRINRALTRTVALVLAAPWGILLGLLLLVALLDLRIPEPSSLWMLGVYAVVGLGWDAWLLPWHRHALRQRLPRVVAERWETRGRRRWRRGGSQTAFAPPAGESP